TPRDSSGIGLRPGDNGCLGPRRAGASGLSGASSATVCDGGVVTDHLGHDECEPLLRELRVEVGVFGEAAEPGDLLLLACGIGGRQTVLGLQLADLLRAPEALR